MITYTLTIDYVKLLKEIVEDIENKIYVEVIDDSSNISTLKIMLDMKELMAISYFTSEGFAYNDFISLVSWAVKQYLQKIKKV